MSADDKAPRNAREGVFIERIAALEAELAKVRQERDAAVAALKDIGDFAHDRSTGPAVPDTLWEIRRMAYDELAARKEGA